MQKLTTHQTLFLIIIANYYLRLIAAAGDSSPTMIAKKFGQLLNGAHLEFVVAHAPPSLVMTKGPDGNYSHTGSSTLLIDWLSKKLNFTYTYFSIPNNITKAKYGNMSDFGVIYNLLVNKEVDGSALPVFANAERIKLVDFAYFIMSEPHVMVVPRRGEEPRLFAFIRPFEQSVWLSILFTMVVVVCLMTLLTTIHSRYLSNKFSKRMSEQKHSIWQTASFYAMYVINIITNQGESVPGSRLSFRILMGAWLLAAMVLVNCYSGTVVSYLTAPKMIPSINTLQDLAASEDVGVVLFDNTVIAQDIMDAQSGTLKILGDQVRRYPDRQMNNIPKAISVLETGHYALPFLQTFCNDFVAKQFKKEGNCRFKTTDPITSSAFLYLPLQKNSKFTSEFYFAKMKAWEMGFLPYWMEISSQKAPKCFTKKRPQTTKKMPIVMEDLFGAFLILGVGLGLGTAVFFTEYLIFFFKTYCFGNLK